jgi:acyl-CoA thioester hydrolase
VRGFRHTTRMRVRNFEVDWQGIVHNSIYLQYFETARIEYLRDIGHVLDLASVNRKSRVVLARNEVDYIFPARFDDLLEVGTRVSLIGTSSFVFDGVIQIRKTGTLIAKNHAVHVWLHPEEGYPVPIPGRFIRNVEEFERRKIPRKITYL